MSYTNRNYIYITQLYKSSSDTGSDCTPRIIIFDDNINNNPKIEEIIQKGRILGIEFLHENSIKYLVNCINKIVKENKIITNAIQDIKTSMLRIRNLKTAGKLSIQKLEDMLISDVNLSCINQHIMDKVNSRMAILPKNIKVKSNSFNKEINIDLNNDFNKLTSTEYREIVIKFINLIENQYKEICEISNLIESYKKLVLEIIKDNKDIDLDEDKINKNTIKLLSPILNCFLINVMSLLIFVDADSTISLDNEKFIIDCLLNLITNIQDNSIIDYKIYKKFLKTLNNINNLSEKPIITVTNNNLTINYRPISKSFKYL